MPQTSNALALAPVEPISPPDAEEYGVALDLPFAGWHQDEVYNPLEDEIHDLLGRLDQMIRNDGHMAGLYRLVTLPIRQATWRLEPAEGDTGEAQFLDRMLRTPPHLGGMSTSMSYILSLLGKASLFGFAAFEECYQLTELEGHGLAITLRKLAPREPHTIRFKADRTGGFNGLIQRAYFRGKGTSEVHIPRDKSFFFTVDKEHHPFYGRSMFLPALYHYDRKHRLYWIAHIAAQFSAIPGRIGYQDQGDLTPSQKKAFREALANFGFNTAVVPPKGTRIEPFSGTNSGAAEDILHLIEHHNIQSAQGVLAQFMDLGQQSGGSGGSYAMHSDSSSMFMLGEEALLGSIAEHMTWHVLPKFIDWNFGTRKYPRFVFDPLTDDMREAMTTIFTAAMSSPEYRGTDDFLLQLERTLSEKFGLPIDYDAIETEKEAAKDAADRVADTLNKLTRQPVVAEKGTGGELPPPPPEPGKKVETSDEPDMVWLAEVRTALSRFQAFHSVDRDGGRDQQPVVLDIQRRLIAAGHDPGATDGIFADRTVDAVAEFQKANGLPPSGRVDLGTYALLLEQTPDIAVEPEPDDDTPTPDPISRLRNLAGR